MRNMQLNIYSKPGKVKSDCLKDGRCRIYRFEINFGNKVSHTPDLPRDVAAMDRRTNKSARLYCIIAELANES